MASSKKENPSKGNIAFLQSELGLGRAARLLVDAALGLQQRGYDITIFTGHHNPTRSFTETIDGTLKVVSVCPWFPRSLFGRCESLCSYVKMTLVALYVKFLSFRSSKRPKVVICDQVSACITALKILPCVFCPKILFYCHFPDELNPMRESYLKRICRTPFSWLEEFATGLADKIVVSSMFTRSLFHGTFKRVNTVPDVLYPSINTSLFDSCKGNSVPNGLEFNQHPFTFLSINQFEAGKNIALAIRSLKKLRTCLEPDEWNGVHMVLAGDYDVNENSAYLEYLHKICKEDGMIDRVSFICSPNDDFKAQLIEKCFALLYTPSNDHFGVVPLEAMYMAKPIIAVDSGGPMETVINEKTGFLCPSNEIHFAASMARLVKDPKLAEKLGSAGKARFHDNFSFDVFSLSWDRCIEGLISTSSRTYGYGRADLAGKIAREHID